MDLNKEKKTVSLVLGSGGARGLAHIGVIHWLTENGYTINAISGCSMGALIGGIYAIGKLDEYEQWVRAVTRRDIFALLDLSFQRSGLFDGERIISTLKGMLGDTNIEDLPISFTAVATNLEAGREVWLNKGPLFDAIRASISIPLLFTPFKRNGVKLVDGAILNPVPIAPTFSNMTSITIAVNVSGDIDNETSTVIPKPETETTSPSSLIQNKINTFIDELKVKANSYLSTDTSMLDIAIQSFDAMQSTIARQKLAAYPPDISLEIPRDACKILEFDRADELIHLGFETAAKSIKQG